MVRFQVRKRDKWWEVVVLEPGKRCWEILDKFNSFDKAMILATGQTPYGDPLPWYRSMRLVWVP